MDKRVSRKYFNEKAERWDETIRNNDANKLQALADRLSIPQQAWILDVGTGTGVFLSYIKERVNHNSHVFCMDFAFNMLIKAKSKYRDSAVDFVCAEIETLQFSPNLFDVVMCYSTFPHFHDKPGALSTIHHLLKPGGRLYIGHTASRETINNIHRAIPDFRDHLIPEKPEMKNLLHQAGFSEFDVTELPESYLAAARK
jgi:demethylmenaquinone methyltransferase/2-methoxy-6-polyprenyl-1,4-benzoquinol methylase